MSIAPSQSAPPNQPPRVLHPPNGPPPRGSHDPGTRDGRFQSVRGPMGLSGWLRYPAALLRARLGTLPGFADERPWLVPGSIGYLRRRMRRDWRLLELGSGASTVWYARHCGELVSFEDDEHWFERTAALLREHRLDHAEVVHLDVERLPEAVAALPDEGFDMAILDFLEAPTVTRNDLVEPLRDKLRPGGLLVLDDSDRPAYARAYELLKGWRERRFTGIKDGWPQVCETTVFRKPRA